VIFVIHVLLRFVDFNADFLLFVEASQSAAAALGHYGTIDQLISVMKNADI